MIEVHRIGRSPAHDAYLAQAGIRRLDPSDPALAGLARLTHLSVQFYGEHCTECAAPDCHGSCGLFNPSEVGRCRRFGDGIVMERCAAPDVSYGMEVLFLPASRLFAVGNTRCIGRRAYRMAFPIAVHASRLAYLLQSAFRFLSPRAHWVAADRIRGLGNRVPRFLNAMGARAARQPDSLALAIGNPQAADVAVELSVSGFGTSPAERSFRRTLVLSHGWHLVRLPIEEIRAAVDIRGLHRICLTPLIDRPTLLQIPYAGYALGPADFAASSAAAIGGRPGTLKLLVLDLDETLWEGIAIEDPDRITELRPGVRELLEELDRRGILLSIASKNNPADALAILDRLGIRDLFLYPQIGWGPKSAGIRAVVSKLNIGMDAVGFADDSAFERAEVKASLPAVRTYDAAGLTGLPSLEELDVPVTDESRARRRMYREEESRGEAMASASLNYAQFLAWSGMKVSLKPLQADNAERVFELVQRTNQLNFSGSKYTREALERILADPRVVPVVVSCSDRFGAYGIVGFALLRASGDTLAVEDLMFSCRIQGKQVEPRLLRYVSAAAARAGLARCDCLFRPTARNAPAAAVLDGLDFASGRADEPGGLRRYRLAPVDAPAPGDVADEADLAGRLAAAMRAEGAPR